MARPFPYTFISCPCAETSPTPPGISNTNRLSKDLSNLTLGGGQHGDDEDTDDEERTFDPRSPRANYSLYPPEHLLYCEDCHQIKCPRCITEEIVCYYCPNCLFETPSSMVRSEGNRCARNCFNCPSCTSPLAVSTLGTTENGAGPWILSCGYCMWTTLDVGIKFDKPTNIRAQLQALTNPGGQSHNNNDLSRRPSEIRSPLASFSAPDEQPSEDEGRLSSPVNAGEQPTLNHEARFAALKSFYRSQLAESSTSPTDPLMGSDLGGFYSSPSALSRIMSLYAAGIGKNNSKKPKSKPPLMREALTEAEGLHIPAPDAEEAIIQRMSSPDCTWDSLTSTEQRTSHISSTRFVEDLHPLPVLLRTKRSKRCKACKHILVKPEFKPQSTRFRIRLIALSYIPLTIIRALVPPGAVPTTPVINLSALRPDKPIQFLLTLKNHMFEPIRVTLATPSLTPGRVATKVTMLCPTFDVGANSDVWDEALQSSSTSATTADSRLSRSGSIERVAEAGKVWDRGRNWTTVAMEVVPGSLLADGEADADKGEGEGEDESVLEIPVFVRLEWETESGGLEASIRPPTTTTTSSSSSTTAAAGNRHEPDMVKRELAYWMVLGVGRLKR